MGYGFGKGSSGEGGIIRGIPGPRGFTGPEGPKGNKGEPGFSRIEAKQDVREIFHEMHYDNPFSYLLSSDAAKYVVSHNSSVPVSLSRFPHTRNVVNRMGFRIASPLEEDKPPFKDFRVMVQFEVPDHLIAPGDYTLFMYYYIADGVPWRQSFGAFDRDPGITIVGSPSAKKVRGYYVANVKFTKIRVSGDVNFPTQLALRYELDPPTLNSNNELETRVMIYGIRGHIDEVPYNVNDQFFSLELTNSMVAQRDINMGKKRITEVYDAIEDSDAITKGVAKKMFAEDTVLFKRIIQYFPPSKTFVFVPHTVVYYQIDRMKRVDGLKPANENEDLRTSVTSSYVGLERKVEGQAHAPWDWVPIMKFAKKTYRIIVSIKNAKIPPSPTVALPTEGRIEITLSLSSDWDNKQTHPTINDKRETQYYGTLGNIVNGDNTLEVSLTPNKLYWGLGFYAELEDFDSITVTITVE